VVGIRRGGETGVEELRFLGGIEKRAGGGRKFGTFNWWGKLQSSATRGGRGGEAGNEIGDKNKLPHMNSEVNLVTVEKSKNGIAGWDIKMARRGGQKKKTQLVKGGRATCPANETVSLHPVHEEPACWENPMASVRAWKKNCVNR